MTSFNVCHEVPGRPFTLKLSPWDQRFPPMYSKRLLFFSFPSSSESDVSDLVTRLRSALQSTIDEVPFLSGEVAVNQETPWVYNVQQASKVLFVVKDLRNELDFRTLREAGFPSADLDANVLCNYPKPMYVDQSGVPVCVLRLDLLGGEGVALVLQIAHTVCDGVGITSILNILVKHLREDPPFASSLPNQNPVSRTVEPEDRTTFAAGSLSHENITDHPAWKHGPVTGGAALDQPDIQCLNLFISEERLSELKALATKASRASDKITGQSSDTPTWISTHDAVCGLIWQSLIAARHAAGLLTGKEETYFTTAVDCRKRLGLPDTYLGNAIDAIRPSLPIDILTPSTSTSTSTKPDTQASTTTANEQLISISRAATAIGSAITSVTASSFRGLVSCVERTSAQLPTRLAVMESLRAESVMVISLFHSGVHELDFGERLGRLEACRLGRGSMVPGVVYVLPRVGGPEGGCEVVVNEPVEVLRALVRDRGFARFVDVSGRRNGKG